MSIGPANDRNTPVDLPNNDWTRMIEAVKLRNERGVSLSPEDIEKLRNILNEGSKKK